MLNSTQQIYNFFGFPKMDTFTTQFEDVLSKSNAANTPIMMKTKDNVLYIINPNVIKNLVYNDDYISFLYPLNGVMNYINLSTNQIDNLDTGTT